MGEGDWVAWHQQYGTASSPLSARLAVVRSEIRDALDEAPAGTINVVSACSGDGRDLLGVLEDHPRGSDVRARLVELDPQLAASAATLSPPTVEVRCADAGSTGVYLGAVPAQVVLMCGVFGNISNDDVRRTIEQLPAFCLTGGRVIWTRHRRAPDLTPEIRRWFQRSEFEELKFHAAPGAGWSVGVHRYVGSPTPLPGGLRLFTFERGGRAAVERKVEGRASGPWPPA